ncbi:MAG TPA: PAS domain S-box protein [Candidatus Cloacimonadota bacterium]|nr:PAS domain S-box protein [Candidatus Cloacimonadota bacterium]
MINSQSRAEKIIEHDPNGLVVVDRDLNIVQVNKAFLKIFDLTQNEKIIGRNVNEVLEQVVFPSPDITTVHSTFVNHKRSGRIVQLITFQLYDEENLSACFCVDNTAHVNSTQKLLQLRKETAEKAHQIINKQMQTAQEIASLLGETTAESKAALLKLVHVIEKDEELHD